MHRKTITATLGHSHLKERVRSPEISHKITAGFPFLDLSGPIVSETIYGVLEKESVVSNASKYFERIVCMTTNNNYPILSQSFPDYQLNRTLPYKAQWVDCS